MHHTSTPTYQLDPEETMSTYRRIALMSLLISSAVLPPAVGAQGTESLAGTWKLNAAKSKWSPASLGSKSGTSTFTFSGKSVTANVDQVNAKDQKVHFEYTAPIDGADSPWKGTTDGTATASQDAVSFKKLNAHTYHIENKLKGKVLTTNHIVVAADGKSRTVTVTGRSPDGQKIHHVLVYEKQ